MLPEIESNNTPDFAQVLFPGSGRLIVNGSVVSAGDLDYYRVNNIPAGARAWLYVDGGGAIVNGTRDTAVDIFGADGTTLIESDDDDGTGNGSDGSTETLNSSSIAGRRLITGGTYYIRVRGNGPPPGANIANPYRLFLVFTNQTITQEAEPNNTAATATGLIVANRSSVISGLINAPTDVDYYSMQLFAGDIVSINVDADPGRLGVEPLDGILQLFAPDGTTALMIPAVDSGPGGPNNSEAFSYLIFTTGTYTVRVAGSNGESIKPYNITAWTCNTLPALAPAPGTGVVTGRVLTPAGLGLRNAVVIMTGFDGTIRTATTSSFGVYRFENVPPGSSFLLAVNSRRYRFLTIIVQVFDPLVEIDLVGSE